MLYFLMSCYIFAELCRKEGIGKLGNDETVTTDTLAKICRALNCTVDDITMGSACCFVVRIYASSACYFALCHDTGSACYSALNCP